VYSSNNAKAREGRNNLGIILSYRWNESREMEMAEL
jgi:hypothetical protein